MRLRAKEHRWPPEAEKDKDRPSPRPSVRDAALLTQFYFNPVRPTSDL